MKTLKAKGLYTFGNTNVSIPEGGMTVATNVVIDEPDVVQPRRGLPVTGGTFPSGGTADAGAFYQGKLIVHTAQNKLAYADPSTGAPSWTELSGTYTPPTGQAMRFVQANGNLYFTTSSGVYRLDAYNGTPTAAGGLAAIQGSSAQTGTTGFQSANTQVGYRVLWGIKDANNNYIYGTPSGRFIQSGFANPVATTSTGLTRATSTVTATTAAAHGYVVGDVVYLASTDANFPSGNKTIATVGSTTTFTYTESGAATTSTAAQTFYYASRNVSVTVNIPSGATTSNFAQVYRTAQSADATVDPGDEMGLVYEYVPTNVDISNGSFTFTDIAPDSLRGAALYTNPSQEGIAQENDPPPTCADLVLFKDSVMCSKVNRQSTITIRLLAIGGTSGLQTGQYFYGYAAGNLSFTLIASSTESGQGFKVYTTGTTAQNIADTANSMVRVINATASGFTAFYASGPDDPPGIVRIVTNDASGNPGYIWTTSHGSAFSPALPEQQANVSLSRSGSTVTASITGYSHSYSVGQQVWIEAISPSGAFPVGAKTIASIPDSTHFTYTEAGTATTASNYTASSVAPVSIDGGYVPTAVPQQNGIATNGLAISKASEPEAFPTLNQFTVGASTSTILRVIPLRDSVFIFTDYDGVYRLTGSSPADFRVDLFDPTVRLLAPKSAVTLGNRIYALTNQGVVAISDTGVEIVSRPIEGDLNALVPTYGTSAVAASYESDRKYLLSIGGATYVYNYLTDCWVKWSTTFAWAAVDPVADRLWLSDSSSALRRENKSYTFLDYADGTLSRTISSVSGQVLTLDSVSGISVGDAIGDGSQYDTITAVGASTVTVASKTFAAGAVTVYARFSSQVQWSADELDDSGKLKQAREASFLFGASNFTSATADFSTDISTAVEHVTLAGSDTFASTTSSSRPIRTYLPQEKQYCTQLQPGLTVTNALASWRLEGLSVVYRVLSERTTR